MSKTDKDQSPTTFPEKWMKVLKDLPEFRDTVEAAGTEDLKKTLFTCEGHAYTIEKERSEDEKLNAAKETVKEFSAPYRDSLKVITAKIKYCLFLLEGKGVDLS